MPRARDVERDVFRLKLEVRRDGASEARRLRGLEEESTKLKRLFAEAILDNAGLKDLVGEMVTPAAICEAVAHLRASLGVSEPRACGIIGADRTSLSYRSKRGDDTALRVRLRGLAQQRRRFGYRRLHILLLREGVTINRWNGASWRCTTPEKVGSQFVLLLQELTASLKCRPCGPTRLASV